MFIRLSPILALICVFAFVNVNGDGESRVVCYYNSNSFVREGLGKVTIADIEPALSFCTHLVYGYAGLSSANKLVSLNENLDLDQGRGHYRVFTTLKRKFPNLKILLSVGGGFDVENREQYLTLLESSAARIAFINSAYTIIKTYGFDGLDLAWDFPTTRPIKIKGAIKAFWHKFKDAVGVTKGPVDEKSDEHKEEFTALVRELKNSFRHDGYLLSTTVLPNVNASLYYDVLSIINNLDFVNIAGFDFQTPVRNPKRADFPAPLYQANERLHESNINFQVTYWLNQRVPAGKIILGIPTFGRTWKMTDDSGTTGYPPIVSDEGGEEGPQTHHRGLLSWPEICAKLPNPSNANLHGEQGPLTKVGDPTKRFGPYAFRLPDGSGDHGIWVGYDDPDTAGNKAGYVRAKSLGGIAIFDLSMDDFRGSCTGDKFPILRAAKYRL